MFKKLSKFIAAIAILAAIAGYSSLKTSAATSAAQINSQNNAQAGFYPVVKPTSYFVIAGSTVRFRGAGFEPNEHIDIAGNGIALTVQANSGGSFTTAPIAVGFNGGNSSFVFTGQNSNADFISTIKVADWNPYITLSSYYNSPGSALRISGRQFGANETVALHFGGMTLGSIVTNAGGSFVFNAKVPAALAAGTAQLLSASGGSTGKIAIQTFTVR